MNRTIKKLGEAELEIMQVIWSSEGAVTSNYILQQLHGLRQWKLSTLMTSLSRLTEKGFLSCDRSTGSNLYSPVISENAYRTKESRRFLDKLYHSSLQNMVATLYSSKEIKASELRELREYLGSLEDEL